MMTLVCIKDLTKKFGKFTALDKINLNINKGEIYGFIGPNGAGKTTTIRLLLGLLKKTSGEVHLFNKDAFKEAVAIHKRVSYVPGDINLWPNLTGGEVIDLFLNLHGSYNLKKKEELIKEFKIDLHKKCQTYSKGNKQKVVLIAALLIEADLYIFDEPTAGLDPLMEKVFQKHLLKLKKEGKSIFLSSHLLTEVEKVCDKVSIIKEGKIIETGSLKDLKHLTRLKMLIETKKKIPTLNKVMGIYDVKEEERRYSFQVDKEYLSQVIQYISSYEVIHLESSLPTLEDLFMDYYHEDGVRKNV